MPDLRLNEAFSRAELEEFAQFVRDDMPLIRRWRELYNQLAGATQELNLLEFVLGAASALAPNGRIPTSTNTVSFDLTVANQLLANALPVVEALTISGGAITVQNAVVSIITLTGETIPDDLNNILGGQNGQLLHVTRAAGQNINYIDDGVGNLRNHKRDDINTSSPNREVTYVKTGTVWRQYGLYTSEFGVPLAALVDGAESTLAGRGQGSGAGAYQAITLGTNLAMVGATLHASGGGGSVTLTDATITLPYSNKQSDTVNVVDAGIGVGSEIAIFWGTVLAADANNPEMDDVTFTASPLAGSMDVTVSAADPLSRVGGPYKIRYLVA